MVELTPERWQEVKKVLAAALERPPGERQTGGFGHRNVVLAPEEGMLIVFVSPERVLPSRLSRYRSFPTFGQSDS